MKCFKCAVMALFLFLGLLASSAAAESPSLLFQEALYAEETEGDLDKAIGIYQQVIDQAGETERLAAKATYQLGMCYLKKGDKEKAAEYFQEVVNKYHGQQELCQNARQHLQEIRPDAGKSIFEGIDGQVLRFIAEQYGQTAAQANEKSLYANGHVYFVDSNFVLHRGGLGFYYNWTGQTITSKVRLSGTSYPNQTHYDANGNKLNTEIVPDKTRPNHWQIYWIPDEPLAQGESLYYGWSIDDTRKLSQMPGGAYSFRMQNKFGGPVIETFFLVLPKDLDIAQSNSPTGSQELLNFDVYWWTKTVQQRENHVEVIQIEKEKDKITDPAQAKPIIHDAVMTISTLAEGDPRLQAAMDKVAEVAEDTAVVLLAEYLESPRPTVRRAALYIFWKGGFDGLGLAAKKLIALCSHEEEYTRGMAALALGEAKEQSAFDALIHMTANDKSAYARRCGAYALGLLGNPDALPILKKALEDKDFNVKNNADAAITMITELRKKESSLSKGDELKTEEIQKAVKVAEPWLTLVDEGKYSESWDEAAEFFKRAVTREQWDASVKAVRGPLGKLKSREVMNTTYTKQLPGAPDGEYVVITFKASYENKEAALETVTPMLDKDGQWRVSGYYIK